MEHRWTWTELPDAVRAAIESVTGPVLTAEPLTEGLTSPFTAVVRARGRRVFVKATPITDVRAVDHQRREAAAAASVGGQVAPTMLAHLTPRGWDVLLFTHVDGRYADVSPGGPDLSPFAHALTRAGHIQPPHGIALPPLAERWAEYLTPDERALLGGVHVLHTDLNPWNVLIEDDGEGGRACFVDWGMSAVGPAWAELAFAYLLLLWSDHTFESARRWLWQFPAWREAPIAGVGAFVAGAVAEANARDLPAQAERWKSLLAR
ncbi:phosphotransferase [Streptomyces sp. SID3343]|uniref:phosphotransferase family protein n=1 Tax=Streptomyces sp. SID3343 TaxID=2690260 RepID=UPI00136D5FD7|nr:phosphotransferase [Streptomyces sp. SID3343]MYV99696.1 phosphotransferase [Streptomyces sp. SID3343]